MHALIQQGRCVDWSGSFRGIVTWENSYIAPSYELFVNHQDLPSLCATYTEPPQYYLNIAEDIVDSLRNIQKRPCMYLVNKNATTLRTYIFGLYYGLELSGFNFNQQWQRETELMHGWDVNSNGDIIWHMCDAGYSEDEVFEKYSDILIKTWQYASGTFSHTS